MKQLLQNTAAFVAVAVMLGASTVRAQDDTAENRFKIRIEDGKVWVNDKELPEGTSLKDYLKERGLDDIEVDLSGRVRFDGDGEDWTVWIDRNGTEGRARFGRGNVFFSRDGDDDNGFTVDVHNRAPGGLFFRDGDHKFDFDAADFTMSGFGMGPNEILGFVGTSPEVMKMEQESRSLARRVRDASGSERAELEQELDQLLGQIFDAKVEARRKRVEELQSRYEEQRDALDTRVNDRADIIARRKAELLGHNDRFEW